MADFTLQQHDEKWSYASTSVHLNNYLRLHVCLSFHGYVCGYVGHTLGFSVASQKVANKSFLVCVKNEKYAFWVTLRLAVSMQQGKAELCTLH